MLFTIVPLVLVLAGATIHVFVDKREGRRTRHRVIELYLVWLLGVNGIVAIVEGAGHMGPMRAEIAESIGPGYIPSMFQWENAWADVAIGFVLFVSVWKRNGFMTAAILGWVILYWGDAIGHIMQLAVHDNRAPANVGSIPSDVLIPLAALLLLIKYRRSATRDREATSQD